MNQVVQRIFFGKEIFNQRRATRGAGDALLMKEAYVAARAIRFLAGAVHEHCAYRRIIAPCMQGGRHCADHFQ